MIFDYDDIPRYSYLIDRVWHTTTENADEFISTAETNSEIVISKIDNQVTVTVRGPETHATLAQAPAHADFTGIIFKLGTFMPTLLPKNVMNRRDVHLPIINPQMFRLDQSHWEIPNFNNVESFIERLVREELLIHDNVVGDVLNGYTPDLSPRALQYRFKRATGLSQKLIQQIIRAQKAQERLSNGTSIIDTTHELGFYDQAHLTNALKRFLGQTPSQIISLLKSE